MNANIEMNGCGYICGNGCGLVRVCGVSDSVFWLRFCLLALCAQLHYLQNECERLRKLLKNRCRKLMTKLSSKLEMLQEYVANEIRHFENIDLKREIS